jgi:hypothetical protein
VSVVSGIGIKNQNADLLQLFHEKKASVGLRQVCIFSRDLKQLGVQNLARDSNVYL